MTFQELKKNPKTSGIISALDRHISLNDFDLFFRNAFAYKLENLAERIYANDRRDRSLDEIRIQCATGLLGEIAVAQLLFRHADGLEDFRLNDELRTGDYHWDVYGRFDSQDYYFEIKYQAKNTEGFSFRHKEQCETAHQNWRRWNFMVGFYVTEDLTTIVPTSLVMNHAFEELYKPSNQDGGTYLQTGKAASKGWFYQLNIGRRP